MNKPDRTPAQEAALIRDFGKPGTKKDRLGRPIHPAMIAAAQANRKIRLLRGPFAAIRPHITKVSLGVRLDTIEREIINRIRSTYEVKYGIAFHETIPGYRRFNKRYVCIYCGKANGTSHERDCPNEDVSISGRDVSASDSRKESVSVVDDSRGS